MDTVSKIRELLDSSYSAFHAIGNIKQMLLGEGFAELYENEPFALEKGKGYFLIRGGSAIIAFKVPSDKPVGFHIASSHSDSPTFKLKPSPAVNQGGILGLRVEPYGGMIMPSWFDRPLSIAGRLVVEKEGSIRPMLFALDEDFCIIPNLCIHFNRTINESHAYNPDTEIVPLAGEFEEGFDWNAFLKGKANLSEDENILDADLFLYARQKAVLLGKKKELLASPRLDNLTSAYLSILSLLSAEAKDFIPLVAVFDNEEVGSSSFSGADGDFLSLALKRIESALEMNEETVNANSFALSVDNAHARHPNYPATFEKTADVKLNGGVVLKYNASMRYTTDGLSAALVKALAKKGNVRVQLFSNRPDMRGGSTLGNLSLNHVGILTADIGLAQLAMHSSVETMGANDLDEMKNLLETFYSTSVEINGETIALR